MDFHTFYFGMAVPERELFAQRAYTSPNVLSQVAYQKKRVELGFADVLVTLSGGRLSLDSLPLTDRAARQRAIREGRAATIPAPATLEH